MLKALIKLLSKLLSKFPLVAMAMTKPNALAWGFIYRFLNTVTELDLREQPTKNPLQVVCHPLRLQIPASPFIRWHQSCRKHHLQNLRRPHRYLRRRNHLWTTNTMSSLGLGGPIPFTNPDELFSLVDRTEGDYIIFQGTVKFSSRIAVY